MYLVKKSYYRKNKGEFMFEKSKGKILFLIIALTILSGSTSIYAQSKSPIVDEPIKSEQRATKYSKKELMSSKIPMDLAHQDYLHLMCERRDLDYIKTLAIIRHESTFNPNIRSGSNYGYMQIHSMRHKKLSEQLKTANAPYNPYININWGTKILSDLYKTFEKEGYSGDELDRAVWSSYNKGEYGFRRTGEAKSYINRNYNHIKWVKEKLDL